MSEDLKKENFLEHNTLRILLSKLGVAVSPTQLQQACSEIEKDPDLAAKPLLEQLYYVFKKVNCRNVQGLLIPWDRLDKRYLPALVSHDDKWYVVHSCEESEFVLTDQDFAETSISEESLGQSKVLLLKVLQSRKKGISISSPSLGLVFKAMFKTKRWFVEVLLATVLINVLAVAISMYSIQVYDRVVPSFARATLLTLTFAIGVIIFVDWLLKYIRTWILNNVSSDMDREISQKVYDHMLNIRPDRRPQSIGTLTSQVNGLESVRNFFSSSIIFTFTDLPFVAFFIVVIFAVGGRVGFVPVVLLFISVLIGLWIRFRMSSLSKEIISRSSERQGLLVDTIRGSETIFSSGASWKFSDAWKAISSSSSRSSFRNKMVIDIAQNSSMAMSSIAYVTTVFVGVGEIEAGQLTMGGLIACTILSGRVSGPVVQMVQRLSQWENVRHSMAALDELLSLEPFREENADSLAPEKIENSLTLKDIQFSYSKEEPVLRLQIPFLSLKEGDRVAILGSSGSGKSTLLKMLAGLSFPSSGRVLLGNADMWQLDQHIINKTIGYLPQDVHLFKGTLRSNMMMSGLVDDARFLSVIQYLGLDKIAADNLRGMEVKISEGGVGLSVGQRQLVAVSRLFLSMPNIWLLDEPTASMDNEAEARVLSLLRNYVREKDILVVVTHRPKLIELANRIMVMKNGKIVVDGNSEDVLRQIASAKESVKK
ncbi:hypothetical protein AB834_06845 [PVC group bacterium (ex Bugula neritina AB1)]|nr:hypothetical protein AB834_06845 [PVC group bacterium (ex Bugula neritina AB1)]